MPKKKEYNTKNLRPPQTTSEARERGRKGGVKSGEKRREKRTLREAVLLLMSSDCRMPQVKAKMQELGITDEEQTNQMAMTIAMFGEAMKGNVQAFNSLRDTMGEKPVAKTELTGKDGEAIQIKEEKNLTMEEARNFYDELLKKI